MTKPYRNIYSYTKQETPATIKERARQRRVKFISVAVITVECIVGLGVIIYFMNQ